MINAPSPVHEMLFKAVREANLKRRALLIMGALHFQRLKGPGLIERELRDAGASTYLIVLDTKIYDDPKMRFASWPAPSVTELRGNWAGDLPVLDDAAAGPPRISDVEDAVLYLAGAREDLTVLSMPRPELDGTEYGRELNRRMIILRGRPLELPEKVEQPVRRRAN